MSKSEPRIGVYVCHCGLNIGAVVDVAAVAEYAQTLPGVVVARESTHTCSDNGQRSIQEDIENHSLNRVVVASCSPRMHGDTFMKTCETAGLNPYLFEMANIREQCSWVHTDKEQATEKAKDLVRMAVAKVQLLEPLEKQKSAVNKAALVIGGGVAGIFSALYLANAGIKTYIVEKKPSIGGHMAQLDKTFPTLDCSLCILSPRMADVGKHENIELITYADVEDVSGYAGNFHVTVKSNPRYVIKENCRLCGVCTEKCPVSLPDEFNVGLKKRKAVYIPFPQAVPNYYLIDADHCLHITKGGCMLCQKNCPNDAIDFDQTETVRELHVGAIIVATGFGLYDATQKKEYGYGRYPNVITNMDFERWVSADGPTHGKVVRPSDGKPLQRIGFIQCVGSRDEREGAGYCSRICCMATVKQASMLREKYPDAEIYVYYTDMRTPGKGFEEFYQKGREQGIVFIRGKPGEIEEDDNHNLIIVSEDTDSGLILRNTLDLVVLACGLRPPEGLEELAQMLHLSRSPDGFIMEAHPKLRPAETSIPGVLLTGCVQFPKDIPDTVAQSGGAAAMAAALLTKDEIELEPVRATVDEELCIGCGLCEDNCDYGAIEVKRTEEGMKAQVIEVACQGCGVCAASCPQKAVTIRHFTDGQLLAQVAAALEPEVIL
ncbi:MAG: CoB--CoM heterodisulfide reductase iron-sulfur subunit A family protein [Candidatus Methanofastidiosia archaeon]